MEGYGVGVLDTGGQFTMIDAGLAKRIHAKVVGERLTKTACGTCTMRRVEAQVRIAELAWRGGTFESTPLPTGTPPIVAVVGMDFLGRGRFETDGSKRRWRFFYDGT